MATALRAPWTIPARAILALQARFVCEVSSTRAKRRAGLVRFLLELVVLDQCPTSPLACRVQKDSMQKGEGPIHAKLLATQDSSFEARAPLVHRRTLPAATVAQLDSSVRME